MIVEALGAARTPRNSKAMGFKEVPSAENRKMWHWNIAIL